MSSGLEKKFFTEKDVEEMMRNNDKVVSMVESEDMSNLAWETVKKYYDQKN